MKPAEPDTERRNARTRSRQLRLNAVGAADDAVVRARRVHRVGAEYERADVPYRPASAAVRDVLVHTSTRCKSTGRIHDSQTLHSQLIPLKFTVRMSEST